MATIPLYVELLLIDPTVLTQGLRAYWEERDRENAPIWEGRKVTEDLLTNSRAQVERWRLR
jgi:hypothetical protein